MNLIIVDGYNVINSSGRLSGLPLEHARDVLFDLLRDYAGFTNVSVRRALSKYAGKRNRKP